MLLDRALSLVREERVNAEWAVQRAFEDLSVIFDSIDDAYLRERKGDVADIVGRLRMNLNRTRGRGPDLFRDVEAPSVLIADELTPSMAAQVDWRKILGFASDIGSRTHHTAILARSLQVPAVVGLGQASTRVAPGIQRHHRRRPRRNHRRSAAGDARGGAPAAARAPAPAVDRPAPPPGARDDVGWDAHLAAGEHRTARGPRGGARPGRGGHRPLPLGVPARHEVRGNVDGGGAVLAPTGRSWRAWRPGR